MLLKISSVAVYYVFVSVLPVNAMDAEAYFGTSKLQYRSCCKPPKELTSAPIQDFPKIYCVLENGAVAAVIQQNISSALPETRKEVYETLKWPHCAQGHLMMQFSFGLKVGSGVLIGPSHVLTAGHNLYCKPSIEKPNEMANKIWFTPALSGTSAPLGRIMGRPICHPKWMGSRQDEKYDLGIVCLDTLVGNEAGWFGILYAPDIFFKECKITVTGYPGEKGSTDYYSVQMWEESKRFENNWFPDIKNIKDEIIRYDIQTSGGQSGGAVWCQLPHLTKNQELDFFVIGIHACEKTKGVRITKDKFNWIINEIKLTSPIEHPIRQEQADELWNMGNKEKNEIEAIKHFYDAFRIYAATSGINPIPEHILCSLAGCYFKLEEYMKAFFLYVQTENSWESPEIVHRIGFIHEKVFNDRIACACFYRRAEALGYSEHLPLLPDKHRVTHKTVHNLDREGVFITNPKNEGYMQKLDDAFRKDEARVIIAGGGGLGKTTLARHYAHRNKGFYDYVFWVTSTNDDSLWSGYRKILRKLDVKCRESDDHDEILEKLEHALNSSRFLLIYDGVPSNFFFNTEKKIPTCDNNHILITTRHKAGWDSPKIIKMKAFYPDNAVDFLFARINSADVQERAKIPTNQEMKDSAKSLAILLCCHPLALSHAAAHMRQKRLDGRNYTFVNCIETFGKIGLKLLRGEHGAEQVNEDVAYPYLIGKTLEVLERDMKQPDRARFCGAILNLCSYLDPNNIMIEFFSELEEQAERKGLFPFSDLVSFDLITIKSDGVFAIHDLIQEVLLDRQRQQQKAEETITVISRILSDKVKGLYTTNKDSYERMLKYLLNASVLLNTIRSLSIQPESYEDLLLAKKILCYMLAKGNISLDEYVPDIKNKAQVEKLRKMLTFKSETSSETIKWLKAAADKDFIGAMIGLGKLCFLGERGVQNYAEAMRWLQKVADKGIAQAMDSVGALYEDGLGVSQDYVEAMKWYKKAADKGHVNALNNIGFLYSLGLGVPKDHVEAMKWYKKAADEGHATAINNIGCVYREGSGVPQDYVEAMKWYKKSANVGYSGAMHSIGFLYMEGSGVPQDYVKAMKWYKKAADKGRATAMNDIGFLYSYGLGVLQDYAEAMKWYKKAADKDDCRGYYSLGKNFLRQENFQKAKECFEFILSFPENSFQESNGNFAYWYALGCIYWNSYDVVEKNTSRALECFEKAYKIYPYDIEMLYVFAMFLEDLPEKNLYTARIKELYQKASPHIPEARERLSKFLPQYAALEIQAESTLREFRPTAAIGTPSAVMVRMPENSIQRAVRLFDENNVDEVIATIFEPTGALKPEFRDVFKLTSGTDDMRNVARIRSGLRKESSAEIADWENRAEFVKGLIDILRQRL